MGKALAGAIVGTILAIGLLVAAGYLFQIDSLWPAILMGFLSGLAMRTVARGGSNLYLKGALAAVAVLVGVVAGKLALAALLTQTGPQTDLMAQGRKLPDAAADVDSADGGGAGDAAVDAPGQQQESAPPNDSRRSGIPSAAANAAPDIAPMDGVWLVVGALIAYQLGKGEGRAKADEPLVEEPKLVYPD